LASALGGVDILFTIIFTLEMAMKLVAYGLYFGDDSAYLRDAWNCMDGFIVVIGIVGKALEGQNLGWVRALRTMRVLRPLRVISRVPELKVVVNALFNSLPGLANVLLVSLLFWLLFGILGMQLFMGAFARCSDGNVEMKSACVDGVVNSTTDIAWNSITKVGQEGRSSPARHCPSHPPLSVIPPHAPVSRCGAVQAVSPLRWAPLKPSPLLSPLQYHLSRRESQRPSSPRVDSFGGPMRRHVNLTSALGLTSEALGFPPSTRVFLTSPSGLGLTLRVPTICYSLWSLECTCSLSLSPSPSLSVSPSPSLSLLALTVTFISFRRDT